MRLRIQSQTTEVAIRTFTASTEGQNRLALRELPKRNAVGPWVADFMTQEPAAESVLDCFKRGRGKKVPRPGTDY